MAIFSEANPQNGVSLRFGRQHDGLNGRWTRAPLRHVVVLPTSHKTIHTFFTHMRILAPAASCFQSDAFLAASHLSLRTDEDMLPTYRDGDIIGLLWEWAMLARHQDTGIPASQAYSVSQDDVSNKREEAVLLRVKVNKVSRLHRYLAIGDVAESLSNHLGIHPDTGRVNNASTKTLTDREESLVHHWMLRQHRLDVGTLFLGFPLTGRHDTDMVHIWMVSKPLEPLFERIVSIPVAHAKSRKDT